jgi:hypothetical protein
LAGTASQYSKNAMPQLTMMTDGSKLSLNFKWPYQAKLMKTLEANSISIGSILGEIAGIGVLFQGHALAWRMESGSMQIRISFDFKHAKVRRIASSAS